LQENDSERQILNVFSHMQKLDLQKKIEHEHKWESIWGGTQWKGGSEGQRGENMTELMHA
jgi:hypothetical protein